MNLRIMHNFCTTFAQPHNFCTTLHNHAQPFFLLLKMYCVVYQLDTDLKIVKLCGCAVVQGYGFWKKKSFFFIFIYPKSSITKKV